MFLKKNTASFLKFERVISGEYANKSQVWTKYGIFFLSAQTVVYIIYIYMCIYTCYICIYVYMYILKHTNTICCCWRLREWTPYIANPSWPPKSSGGITWIVVPYHPILADRLSRRLKQLCRKWSARQFDLIPRLSFSRAGPSIQDECHVAFFNEKRSG